MTPDTRPLPGSIDHGTRWVLEVASRRMDAVRFVSYGSVGGARAAEHLHLIAGV